MSNRFVTTFVGLALVFFVCRANGAVYDLKTQWSDAANPNGVWTYREGPNALPHVASWQSTLGGYTSAQPGWARSENGSDRIPFWHKSLGFENFAHDYQAGDIVVHTQDDSSGVGQGPANVIWTSPDATPAAAVTGGVWMGRDIGRSDHWALFKNSTLLTEGDIASGDAFSRAVPFNFAAGSGGAAAVNNIPIVAGDKLELRLTRTSAAGDFVGVNFTVTTGVPEPGAAGAALFGSLLLFSRSRTRA
jgi:hypothetical protein